MRTEDYIADNIIALCKKRDMSKYRLSQLTGISQSSIGKIIAKESLPTMPTVEKICDALGVTNNGTILCRNGCSSKLIRITTRGFEYLE